MHSHSGDYEDDADTKQDGLDILKQHEGRNARAYLQTSSRAALFGLKVKSGKEQKGKKDSEWSLGE
ncbi:hypothetical protein E4U52_003932 [Claviceps spartinae]|nr:hypothetical protein E4U52_003932 [Claviceps spartinae]